MPTISEKQFIRFVIIMITLTTILAFVNSYIFYHTNEEESVMTPRVGGLITKDADGNYYLKITNVAVKAPRYNETVIEITSGNSIVMVFELDNPDIFNDIHSNITIFDNDTNNKLSRNDSILFIYENNTGYLKKGNIIWLRYLPTNEDMLAKEIRV